MTSSGIRSLLAIFFIIPLSHAEIVTVIIRNRSVRKMTELLNVKVNVNKKKNIFNKKARKIKKRQEKTNHNKSLASRKKDAKKTDVSTYGNKKNNQDSVKITGSQWHREGKDLFIEALPLGSPSLKIINRLELLSSKRLFTQMNTLASHLKIKPLPTQIRAIALAFTFFLKLKSLGTKAQQDLVEAILNLSRIEHYYASLKNPLLKGQKPTVRYTLWTSLLEEITEQEALQRTMFFNGMSKQIIQNHL